MLGRGRRARHPGRHARRGGAARGRGRDDDPARRRQVRQGRLQGLGRPARRRHLGRQRALGADDHARQARRLALRDHVRARHHGRRSSRSSAGPRAPARYQWFKPDPTVFETLDFSWKTLENRLRELAFLNRGLSITLRDERARGRAPRESTYFYEGGIVSFVEWLNENKEALTPVISTNGERDDVVVECALQWTDGYNEVVYSYANNINTIEGGMHLTGFRTAVSGKVNEYARKRGMLKEADAQPLDRRLHGRPHRDRLGEAARTRSSKARPRPSSATPRSARSSTRWSPSGSSSSSRRTRRSRAPSSRSACRRSARARRRRKRAT